jgi:PadR family transcriptional regulator PadR
MVPEEQEPCCRGAGALHGPERPCCRRAGGGGGGALVEPAALAALLNRGAHGYDVRRAISELTGGELEVDAGGLYRVLRRLEAEGFVVSAWSEGDSGPQRRDYEITSEGRELAEDWLSHLRERQRVAGLLADVLSAALVPSKL